MSIEWPYMPITAHAMRRYAQRGLGVQFPATTGNDAQTLLAYQRAGRLDLDRLAQRMRTPSLLRALSVKNTYILLDGMKIVVADGVVVTCIAKPKHRPPKARWGRRQDLKPSLSTRDDLEAEL